MVFIWFAEISGMSVSLPAQFRWIGLILHCKCSWYNETWAFAAPGMNMALARSAGEEFWPCLTRQERAGESLKHMEKAKVPLHLTPEESFWFGPFIDFITCFSTSLSCRSVLGWIVFLPWTPQVSRNPLFERHSQITMFPTKRAETWSHLPHIIPPGRGGDDHWSVAQWRWRICLFWETEDPRNSTDLVCQHPRASSAQTCPWQETKPFWKQRGAFRWPLSAQQTQAHHLWLHWILPTKHSAIPFSGSPGAWGGEKSFLGQGSHTCSILPADWHLGGGGHMDIKLCSPGIHLQLLGGGKRASSSNSTNMPKEKVSPVVCQCSRAGSLRTISLGDNMMCVLKVIRSFHAEGLWHSNVTNSKIKSLVIAL